MTGKDLVVNLATNASGAITSTAAQVVAAINASPAAAALVSASTYRGNAGAGAVHAPRQGQPGRLPQRSWRMLQRGPFQQRVYRIGGVRDGSKVGVFLYCQQHAREWTTPLSCMESAQPARAQLRDRPADQGTARQRRGVHPAERQPRRQPLLAVRLNFQQRKNMTNYCPVTGNSDPAGRFTWGVDLNRNNSQYTLFDGYFGASTQLHQRAVHRPVGGLRAGDQERALGRGHVPEHQVREQRPLLRRLLHVGAGLLHRQRAYHGPGAEHRHREVLLRRRREGPARASRSTAAR